MQRLLIVYNPNSSQFIRVKNEILARISKFNGYAVGKFAINKIAFEKNVARLKSVLADGDMVLAAGGDATAAVTVNAILQSDRNVTLAVLPYGNFNDLARTLGMTRQEAKRLFLGARPAGPSPRAAGANPRAAALRTPCERAVFAFCPFYPLEIYVDGKFWRYASCYVTIGMTAEAVEIFDEPKIRKKMQKGHKSSWRSYVQLAKWYFKNRHKKVFLPRFSVNGKVQRKKMSDYAAVNGASMCRVMRGGEDFKKPKVFRSMVEKTVSFPKLFMLMAKSILVRTPGVETTGDVLEFVEPATVELQAEGEYQIFKDVKKIEVKKGTKCLTVISKR